MAACNIDRIAAKSFAGHVIEDAPSRSWRLGKPGTSCYAFRITWAPGTLAVSGDVGSAVYEVWPAFNTLDGAIDLVSSAGFDYLAAKSGAKKEFDRDETVAHLIRNAYADLRNGYRDSFFKHVCDEYGGDPDDRMDRKEAVREFRDDADLTAERIYSITGDFEAPIYTMPSDARWAFEAVKLWAKMVAESRPQANAA